MSAQEAEVEKYQVAYQEDCYKMGDARKAYAEANLLEARADCQSHLDVGCGRGEMVAYANSIGYESKGLEVVDYLTGNEIIKGYAWAIPCPDHSVDLVTMFDVLEHLLPEDTERTLMELGRVAKKCIFITAANYPSRFKGHDLHINIRSYDEWHEFLLRTYEGAQVTWLPREHGTCSETWEIRFN